MRVCVCVWLWEVCQLKCHKNSAVSRESDRGRAQGCGDWEELRQRLGLLSAKRDRCVWVCRMVAHAQLFQDTMESKTSDLFQTSVWIQTRVWKQMLTNQKKGGVSLCWTWQFLLIFMPGNYIENNQSKQVHLNQSRAQIISGATGN